MGILWIALGIYIFGIALVLFFRPGIMFRKDGGSWKEFGLSNKDSYTIFPFWLFAVLWALLSYTFASFGAIFFASLALRSTNSSASNNVVQVPMPNIQRGNDNILQTLYANLSKNSDIKPISEYVSEPPAQMPGYYVLEARANGPPKYVYFGQQPPNY